MCARFSTERGKFVEYETMKLQDMTEEAFAVISQWKYDPPYDMYSFRGRPNGYLGNRDTWGKEQFCLVDNGRVVGQVSCQMEEGALWVGWALAPEHCSQRKGHLFVQKCVKEIRKQKGYSGPCLLRVAASNQRAVKAYQKAGFTFLKAVQDEVAYSGKQEDFWVM